MRIAIVGSGVVGLLTAVSCASAGHQVSLFEQAGIPSPAATSYDRHRVVRGLHLGDQARTTAATLAHHKWVALQHLLSARFYERVGALTVLPDEDPAQARRMLADAGSRSRLLGPDDLAAHYPQIRFPAGASAVFEFQAGVLLADRVLAAGDMYTKGDDVPELIDYSGGGSAVEWPSTLRSALQLDFDTVVPGHGPIATKQEMADYRQSTIKLVARVREMNRAKKSKEDIAQMLRNEFHWADLHLARGLNGVIEEAQ